MYSAVCMGSILYQQKLFITQYERKSIRPHMYPAIYMDSVLYQ